MGREKKREEGERRKEGERKAKRGRERERGREGGEEGWEDNTHRESLSLETLHLKETLGTLGHPQDLTELTPIPPAVLRRLFTHGSPY